MVVHDLSRFHFDHHPLLIECSPDNIEIVRNRRFKVEMGWFEKLDFKELVASVWNNYSCNLTKTLKTFTARAEWWRKEVYGSIPHKNKRCIARIAGIQKVLAVQESLFWRIWRLTSFNNIKNC